jgi:hypothetical protein
VTRLLGKILNLDYEVFYEKPFTKVAITYEVVRFSKVRVDYN